MAPVGMHIANGMYGLILIEAAEGLSDFTSSFHVIGEIFDKVYYEGGEQFQTNVQTTAIPAGGSAMVEFET